MSTCPNCNKKLSCGCQMRTASNGRKVCTNCSTSYERSLKPQKVEPTKEINPTVWGKNRYKNLNKFVK
jgi:transcription elongation factor Elf1